MMDRKAQIAPFMILTVTVLILAIAATMLIGEMAFQRIRMANIGDSALISSASKFCQALNQIRTLHSRMFLNYLQLQTTLLLSSPFPTKPLGYLKAYTMGLYGIQSNLQLWLQARSIAADAAKNLRSSLYESSFGGALVDEPKPFLSSEVTRDPQSGRILGLDYASYLRRDSHFTEAMREFKRADKDNWYRNSAISYSWNKGKDEVISRPGLITIGSPDPSFQSYLRVELSNVPTRVSVKAMPMVLIFFWCKGPFCWMPGFVIHPWAWIRKIDIGNRSFGLHLDKYLSFSRMPFFSRNVVLEHRNQLSIKGNVWSGYDFRMER